MIASGRPFDEVALQVLAVRGSLDSLLIRLLELELDGCLPSGDERVEVGALVNAALGRRSTVGVPGPRAREPRSGSGPAEPIRDS